MSRKESKRGDGLGSAAKTDPRFASFESNPRFRLPSKHRTKTTIDKRFARILKDDDFNTTARVDKYGRRLKADHKRKALRSIYQAGKEDGGEEDDAKVIGVEDDDIIERELQKADKNYDPARHGGFSSSEPDSDTNEDEDEEDADDATETAAAASMQRLRDAQADIETGEVTRRIAVVNLDWDHIKSTDLMALFSSFVPKGGSIERISIYPSEFGKERMQREELEGPPKEIFKRDSRAEDEQSEDDSDDSGDEGNFDEDDEKIKKDILQEGDDQDFDSDALRSYQLDRLRYYYAVISCSDKNTADKIYQATDGTEYQTSSNFIDLRFIPDEVEFDDEPRDECNHLPSDYKPSEFTTDALQHSKVRLTWDMHPDENSRREDIKRAFKVSRSQLEENDLRAYLASDNEDDDILGQHDDEPEEDVPVAADGPKLSKMELKAKKLRDALGLSSEASVKPSKSGPVGDMQITFAPALTDNSDRNIKDADTEETTIEKYKRKERERKARKKEVAVAKRNDAPEQTDDVEPDAVEKEDLGFDDPFFTVDQPAETKTKASIRKEERLKGREAREAEAAENAAQRAQLEKVMANDSGKAVEHLDHFDMGEILKAEKMKTKKHRKKSKSKGLKDQGSLQDGFKMNVTDDRFKAVFENHEFAIDPSNPRFKATPGMKQLLDEGRKKRKTSDLDEVEDIRPRNAKNAKKHKKRQMDDDLHSLVESVRRKARSKESL